ncbi:MAG: hypothetical protein NVS2B3_17400 [Vulcanimicrobiaceae bacterium]
MNITRIGLGSAFAAVTTAAMLLGAATAPQTRAGATFAQYTAQAALADEGEDEQGEHGRSSEHAQNERARHNADGSHGDNDERGNNGEHHHGDRGHHYGEDKHRHHHDDRSSDASHARLEGTVQSVDGNFATLRLDDGRTVRVETAGTALTIGQHYALEGCYRNDVFVVNCAGTQQSGNGNGYAQQQISGTILSVNGDIVTLVGLPPVRIDVSRARQNGSISGSLSLARAITAYGFSQNGTFFATSIR